MEEKICYDCEATLTADNTAEHEGFDASNYKWGKHCGMAKEQFTKCDDCFNADIDRYLDSLQSY